MLIAVDMSGSDKGPEEVCEGIRIALIRNESLRVVPTGPKELIDELKAEFEDRVEAGFWDNATDRRRNSATAKAIRLLDKSREVDHGGITADAGVFFGNTKVPVYWASIGRGKGGLDLLSGISLPPLALTMPTFEGKKKVYLDGGASVDDVTAEMLWQFAWLGRAFAQVTLGIAEPRVALHSNGEEEEKGDKVTKAAFKLLKERNFPGFLGQNAQMTDLVANRLDVLVSDGFGGNKCFKTAEAYVMLAFESAIRHSHSLDNQEMETVQKVLQLVKQEIGSSNFGSMPLLGIRDAIVMIGHGSADRQAVACGIETAMHFASINLAVRIEQALPPEFRSTA